MNVEIHRAAEVLKHGDAAATGIRDAVRLCPRAQMALHGPVQDACDPSAQVVTPRQGVSQSMRQSQHPLPDRHIGEDVVDEVRGAFGLAPPATTRTEPAPLARELHELLDRAARAPKPREAPGQEAAAQERPELLFDEPRNAVAVAQARGLGEESLDMRLDHRIDGGGTRVAWRVLDGGTATRSTASVPPCSAARMPGHSPITHRPGAGAAYLRARARGRYMNEVRRTCGIDSMSG